MPTFLKEKAKQKINIAKIASTARAWEISSLQGPRSMFSFGVGGGGGG